MFAGKSEKEARELILNQIREYCEKYHLRKAEWTEGEKIHYASRVYDAEEMVNLVDSSLDFWLTSGRYVEEFEKSLGQFLGIKYCVAVNSGSSANLLAFMALTSPLLGERRILPGDEVITVAAGFPTTVAPIVQYGAVPVFVDVTIPQYNIDISYLEEAYSDRTKAVMLAHTLGNPFDIVAVKRFCMAHSLWLVEDNCDALGSMVKIDGEGKYTGTIGDIGTSSFYPPHHITMGEGGAVYTDNSLLNRIVRSMRDWGRDCSCPPGQDGVCGHRFEGRRGALPEGYDHKYVYSHFGYNLKVTDMQAAIGCAQLQKLPGFIDRRKKNFEMLHQNTKLRDLEKWFYLPKALEGAAPSWFGYMFTCKVGVNRNRVVRYLEEHNIQTRMLFAGNLIKQPCFVNDSSNVEYRVIGNLEKTDRIMQNSFWVGVYPGMNDRILEYVANVIKDAVIALGYEELV